MKKLMISAIFASLTLILYPQGRTVYDGLKDKTFFTVELPQDTPYMFSLMWTTLGPLAQYSDVIGMGQVTQKTNDYFIVTIDYALVGCTNGASIKLYDDIWDGFVPDKEYLYKTYFPTNQSRIVFAASTNAQFYGYGQTFWNSSEIPLKPEFNLKKLSLLYTNRSWWYVDRDDGLLLTQFTNILQAARFDRNWTNYFYLCRDGVNSTSVRMREDSFYDLRDVMFFATGEQKQFILDDPLVDQKFKDWMLQKPNP